MCADLGVMQRFQKIVGNHSWSRELAFTARFFSGEEALSKGFVSYTLESKEDCFKKALEIAQIIAKKSPIAIDVTKKSLRYSHGHSVKEGLNHICMLNSAMLQTEDS